MLVSSVALAADFEEYGLSYKITSSTNLTVEVESYSFNEYMDVSIPDKVTINGKQYTVKGIGASSFLGHKEIYTVDIPNSVTYIGDLAFKDCEKLNYLENASSVTSIGMYSFWNCTNLYDVTIPNSVESLGVGCFMGCTNLKSITIPNSVTSIGGSIFGG